MNPRVQSALGYVGIFAASLAAGVISGWLGGGIDNFAYDWMFRLRGASERAPESIVLAIDEPSLVQMGGMQGVRRAVAEALETIAPAKPAAVAVDLILADAGEDDAVLEAAFAKTPRLVLASELIEGGRTWENPLDRFRRHAAAVGHVHGSPGPFDGVTRRVRLEEIAARERRWALGLEAFRLSRGVEQIEESPADIRIGETLVPAARRDSRTMRIRYLRPLADGTSRIPHISLKELKQNPGLAREFSGRVVFVGWTAQSAFRDRWLTPLSGEAPMPGAEINANIFETLAGGEFLVDARESSVVLVCILFAAAGVLAFVLRSGWQAYAIGGVVLLAAHAAPYALFAHGVVFPLVAPLATAWLAAVGAGSWQFTTVRRQLRRAEADRARYQQTLHFVTHEMKTPLTAIQGSSELMTRFKLSEDKRKEIALMINAESKRLARMVETFLNVERLSAGQMELRREPFEAGELVAACLRRAQPLAERKNIRLVPGDIAGITLEGDRELMEYAVYNLLNNAVKYSPAETEVSVQGVLDGGFFRLSVKDQGIGMDQYEMRNLFRKFYRTRRAVESGISGTGIGLAIVQQIVAHHGGRIEVASAPGQGSCFTIVLPARATAQASAGE
ncbi:MAG: CHASE2 domain-containing protein [bacterium]|jgi:signal transduction histidine kinase